MNENESLVDSQGIEIAVAQLLELLIRSTVTTKLVIPDLCCPMAVMSPHNHNFS